MLFTTPAVLWVLFFISVELRLTRSTAFGLCRAKNSPQDCFLNALTVHKEIIIISYIQKLCFGRAFCCYNGYDVKAISEHLGHCNTEITSNIYVHIFKEYKAKMAESIEHDLL